MSLPWSAIGWSVVCEWGISRSYSLVFLQCSHFTGWEHSDSVEECLSRDWGVAGSSLTTVTVLCPWARNNNPCLVLVQPQELEVLSLSHLYSLKTKSSQCHYVHNDIMRFSSFSSPEPKAHGWANSIPVTLSSFRRPSVNIFKHLLWNHWANWTQISYGDSLGCGNECLFKWSWSHDQDGCQAHIW